MFARSLVITALIEYLVLWLLLRKSATAGRIVKVTVAMNALSYGVTAMVIVLRMLSVAHSR